MTAKDLMVFALEFVVGVLPASLLISCLIHSFTIKECDRRKPSHPKDWMFWVPFVILAYVLMTCFV